MKRAEKISDRMGIISRLEERIVLLLNMHEKIHSNTAASVSDTPRRLNDASKCSRSVCILADHSRPHSRNFWQHLDAVACETFQTHQQKVHLLVSFLCSE